MSRIVCIICDAWKPLAERVTDRDFCGTCDRATPNRSTGADHEPIAPGSALHFAEQRELFEQEKRA